MGLCISGPVDRQKIYYILPALFVCLLLRLHMRTNCSLVPGLGSLANQPSQTPLFWWKNNWVLPQRSPSTGTRQNVIWTQKPIWVDPLFRQRLPGATVLAKFVKVRNCKTLLSLVEHLSFHKVQHSRSPNSHAFASVFSLRVMDVGGRQTGTQIPKRHSYNNIRPFWINVIQEFWENFNTAAWNVWNKKPQMMED